MDAGKLRHRVTLQDRQELQDTNGDISAEWVSIGDRWAAIESLSAREFLESQALQSRVTVRITMRYNAGLTASMRILHAGKIYNPQGILTDKDSGLEYVTVPCSEGINDG